MTVGNPANLPNPPNMPIAPGPSLEESTWRTGLVTALDQRLDTLLSDLTLLRTTIRETITSTDDKAQTANDTLQRLLEANMMANTMLNASNEAKLTQQISSLQQMTEIRSSMNDTALNKAQAATDIRFNSVNEFRGTLTDQAASFVTTTILDARLSQVQTAVINIERGLRTTTDTMNTAVSALNAQITGIRAQLMVGGGAVTVMFLAIQLVLNLLHPWR
jgi:hypothetical protein